MTLEELQVLITANTDQFKSELLKIQGMLTDLNATTEKSGKSIKDNMFGSILKGNLVSGVLTSTLNGIKNTILETTSAIIDNGSAYSRLKVATETVAKNAGVTKKQLAGLRQELADANTYGSKAEEVIKTLVLSGLLPMSEALSAVDARTGKTTQGVSALVLTMKDLAAAAGIDSADGIDKLTKFIRRGEATFADGVIEVGNLHKEYQAYAKSVNKSVQDLSAQEMAQVRMNIVMREGRKAYGAYANTMLTSGKAFGSIRDATLSTVEIIGGALEPAIATFANGLLQFVLGIRQAVLDNEDSIKAFANRVAGYLVAIIRIVGKFLSMIPGVGNAFQGMAEFSIKPAKAVKDLGKSANGAADGFGNAAGEAKKLKKELAGFDEMQVINQDKGSGGGGGIGGFGNTGLSDLTVGIEDSSGAINAFADNVFSKFKAVGDFIGGVINGVVGFFTPLTDVIGAAWDSLFSALSATWEEHGAGIMTGIQEFAGNIVKTFQQLFDNLIGPIINPLLDAFKEAWKGGLKDAMKSVFDFVASLVSAGLDIYNKFIFPIINFILNTFKPIWETLGKAIASTFKSVVDTISGLVNGLFKILKGIVDFVMGVFTQDWDKAWNGIKTVFSGIITSLVAVFKGPLNGIIDTLNTFFRNMGNIAIPDWVPGIGGKPFKIPSIPRLATGGEINSPTMAMLGENNKQEVVLPLDRNTGWAEKVAALINGQNSGAGTTLILKVGEETIFEKFIDYTNQKTMRTNTSQFNI